MNGEVLYEMVREAFPDGPIPRDALDDWLKENAWKILTTCYDSAADLLRDLSDVTYEYLVDDLITPNEYDEPLAYELICEEFDIMEE